MLTFKEQVEELIKNCSIINEDKKDPEADLAIIDKGLEESINTMLNKKVEEIFRGR